MAAKNPNNADVFQGGEAFPGAAGKVSNANADIFQAGETYPYEQQTTANTVTGAASLTLDVNIDTAGARTTFSTVSLPIVITTTTKGTLTALGAASLTIHVQITTAGAATLFGRVSLTETVTFTTTGTRTTFGASSLPIVVTFTTSGSVTEHIFGSARLPIVVTITTTAEPPPTPVIITTPGSGAATREPFEQIIAKERRREKTLRDMDEEEILVMLASVL